MRAVGHLFDRVVGFGNLLAAAHAAVRGKRRTPESEWLALDLEKVILQLGGELLAGRWRPGAYRVFDVHEPKERRIAAAPLRDRIVHHAVCHVLEAYFDRWSIAHSYACRVGKGSHRAAHRAHAQTRQYQYFLKADVAKFFDSIDHAVLKRMLRERLDETRLLALLHTIIDHVPPGLPSGKGVPIGNLTSQHLANFYLGPVDRALCSLVGERRYVRYMDDIVVFAEQKSALHRARKLMEEVLGDELHLRLKEPGTVVSPVTEGVPFLGRRIFPGVVRLAAPAWSRFNRHWRRRERALAGGRMSEAAFLASVTSLIGNVPHAGTLSGRRSVPRESRTGVAA